jgi:AraC-like DNA-binding protein
MSVVRGTSLSGYPRLVSELGGDPVSLLRAAHIRRDDVGKYEAFIPLRAVLQLVESSAAATSAPNFGRRLAERQGIDILGPVGVAARTAATVADALAIFNTFMAAYSPALAIRVFPLDEPARSFIEFEILLDRVPPCPQSIELSLGVCLSVLRFLLGSEYSPLSVHLPHDPVAPAADYRRYFGCKPYFGDRRAGFTIRTADLGRTLRRDDVAHRAMVEYLNSITGHDTDMVASVRTIVRQLLPTGAATLDVVASQFNLHPKTMQRQLAAEGTTFAEVVDQVREEAAERYLRDTQISLSHLTRELGYAEQSVLTRSCKRWFGSGPAAYRKAVLSARRGEHATRRNLLH